MRNRLYICFKKDGWVKWSEHFSVQIEARMMIKENKVFGVRERCNWTSMIISVGWGDPWIIIIRFTSRYLASCQLMDLLISHNLEDQLLGMNKLWNNDKSVIHNGDHIEFKHFPRILDNFDSGGHYCICTREGEKGKERGKRATRDCNGHSIDTSL